MTTLADYAMATGIKKETLRSTIRRIGVKMEGHISYGYVNHRKGRHMILDEKAVDLLDEFYHLDKPGVGNIPMTIEKSTKKVPSKNHTAAYKRKYDETLKKLVKSLEENNSLLEQLNASNTELRNIRKELNDANMKLLEVNNKMDALHQRNVWQRIRNK